MESVKFDSKLAKCNEILIKIAKNNENDKENDIFDIEVTKGESCCFYVWSFGHFDAKISLNLLKLYLYHAYSTNIHAW